MIFYAEVGLDQGLGKEPNLFLHFTKELKLLQLLLLLLFSLNLQPLFLNQLW